MSILVDIISYALIIVGSLFCFIGGVGILRLPDFYTRTHASSMSDTMGAGALLIGLMLQSGANLVAVKLLLILIFLFFSSPLSGHALARAAFTNGLLPKLDHDWTKSKPEEDQSSSS